MYQGTLYIISAASGTGKTSLVKALAQSLPGIKTSISYTTRPIREHEAPTQHYHFVTPKEFKGLISQQFFLEYACIFSHYYGTPLHWVTEQLSAGIDVILTIDWQGAHQVKKQLDCVSIFLLPPSLSELQQRLKTRGSEDTATLATRSAAASSEISHHKEFDYAIINDNFTEALLDLQAIVRSHRVLLKKQIAKNSTLLCTLTKKTSDI